jgi:hypothetical protein
VRQYTAVKAEEFLTTSSEAESGWRGPTRFHWHRHVSKLPVRSLLQGGKVGYFVSPCAVGILEGAIATLELFLTSDEPRGGGEMLAHRTGD